MTIIKKYRKIITALLLSLLLLLILTLGFIFWANYTINHDAKECIYDDVSLIPANNAGLLLGTSKYAFGGINPYFQYRIEATKALFDAGKIKYVIVSGDNSRKNYNEPQDMKDALIVLEIPDSLIILDYAGFRTWDSVIRMEKIFGQTNFTIISQEFHNQRAIYIAKKMNVYGYNAKDVGKRTGLKTNIREKFARAKVFIDLLINKEPKFLGEEIEINIE